MNKQSIINNAGEADYTGKLNAIASKLTDWDGAIVIIAHVDPDGDALGSTLALKRALEALGKTAQLAMDVPAYLSFLVEEDEVAKTIEALPENTLLAVLDVNIGERSVGAPLNAAFTVNIDHHGSNPRDGDLSCVEPGKAATALIIKDLIDVLGVAWTPELATPCLTGILTDTGNFRYSNTDKEVLNAAAFLIDQGVDYAYLTDRLQWRSPSYFKMLGEVMSTVEFPLGGKVALAYLTQNMEERAGKSEDDSNDYVGLIRYAENTKIAIFLKEREDATKLSVRTRDGVSAQNICRELGGGGHVAAAGAKVAGNVENAKKLVLTAAKNELERLDLL